MTAGELIDRLVPLLTDAPLIHTDPVLIRDSSGRLVDVETVACEDGGLLVFTAGEAKR